MTTTAPSPASVLPAPPDPLQSEAAFDAAAYAFSAALPAFGTQANALAENVYANAQAAEIAAALAESSVVSAMAAANYKGAWSSLSGPLAIPATVSHSDAVWLLLSGVADVAAHTPGVSSSWQRLSPLRRRNAFVAEAAALNPVSCLDFVENSHPDIGFAVYGMIFAAGLFVADRATSGNTIATSPDGKTWTQRTMPSAGVWHVAYGNGVFVAVNAGGTATAKSTDGITWTAGGALPSAASSDAVPFFMGSTNWYCELSAAPQVCASANNGTSWSADALPAARSAGRIVPFAGGAKLMYHVSTTLIRVGFNNLGSLVWVSKSLPFTPTSNGIYGTEDFDGALLVCDPVAGAKVYRTVDGDIWTDTGKTYGELAFTINGVGAALGSTLGAALTWHGSQSVVRRSRAAMTAPNFAKRIAKNNGGTVFLVPSSVSNAVCRIAPSEVDAPMAVFQ